MTEEGIAFWLPIVLNIATIVIGLYLVGTGVRAVLYFRQQEQLMGTNWVHHSFYRTCVRITVVYAIYLFFRILVLLFSPPLEVEYDALRIWAGIITGVAFIWLGLKPDRLRRQFKEHEGRE